MTRMLTIEASQAIPVVQGARAILARAIELFSQAETPPNATEALRAGTAAARLPDTLIPDHCVAAGRLASTAAVEAGVYDVASFCSAETRLATLRRALMLLGSAS